MPESFAQLDQLLIEACALGGFSELARAADEQPMWWLAVDENQSVIAEWNETIQRLMLTADVGEVPEKRLETALQEALSFNLIWQETGGARLALMPKEDRLRLMVDLHATNLSSEQVADAVINLLQTAQNWRGRWRSAEGEDAEAPPPSPDDRFPPSGFLRV